MVVLWFVVKMLVDRPNLDGSQRPVTTLTDGDVW